MYFSWLMILNLTNGLISGIIYKVIITFWFLIGFPSNQRNDQSFDSPTFRAAVYEYQRFSQKSSINQFNVKRVNLKSYAKAIQVASHHGADLIVFPESGLFGAINRTVASLNYEYIPMANESITPCIDWDDQLSIDSMCVHSLSCLARGFKIYVAAILGEKVNCSLSNDPNCPDHGHYLFNTQILIDSTGKLIAKYHKYHLFFEPIHDIPVEPEVVTISTPFGKFGFLICFDINYLQPAFNLINNQSVDTILFGAHWTDELPFLNAHRVQSGFSIERNVNLLASGINDLPLGAVGSGIYQAGKGPIVYTADIIKGGSKLIIADLPKSRHENRSIHSRTGFVKIIEHNKIDESDHLPYKPWTLELDLFNYTKLTQQSDNIVSCSEKICCQVNYSMKKSTFPTTYYLLVKRWIRPTTKICEQFCGLVAYNLTDYAYNTTQLFNHIQLTGNITSNQIIPSVVTNNFQLISKSTWTYIHKDNVATINLDNNNQPLLGVTLYSRCEKDDQPN